MREWGNIFLVWVISDDVMTMLWTWFSLGPTCILILQILLKFYTRLPLGRGVDQSLTKIKLQK